MKLSDTFCPLPWVHQATLTNGDMLLCCVAENDSRLNLNRQSLSEGFNSSYWNKVRKKMMNGEKPSACKRCWVEEESGYRSHRKTEVDVWRRRIGDEGLLDLVRQTHADGSFIGSPLSIDLRIGNTCNLQCVMCRPQDSIKWVGLAEKIYDSAKSSTLKNDMGYKKSLNIKDYDWQNHDRIWQELKDAAPHLRELIIGGGEPMLLKGQFEFVEYCVRQGLAGNIHLRYHTNLTVFKPEFMPLWKEFQVVEFFPSIDGLGEKNYYNRYPADWSTIEKNLRILEEQSSSNMLTMIMFSGHFLSLFDLDQLCRWIEDQKFKKVTHGFNGYLHPAIVMHPAYLSPQVYPARIKNIITEKLQKFEAVSKKKSNKIEGVLQYMNASDRSNLLPTTLEYIKELDLKRGTHFDQTFPELYQMLCEEAGYDFLGLSRNPSPAQTLS